MVEDILDVLNMKDDPRMKNDWLNYYWLEDCKKQCLCALWEKIVDTE